MRHHDLDINPIPEKVVYVNEMDLADGPLYVYEHRELFNEEVLNKIQPDDNVRIYVPIDLNEQTLLGMMQAIISHFGEASERNESDYHMAATSVINRIEIYDQIWFVRETTVNKKHSAHAIELVRKMITVLDDIPDAGAECFPWELIDELREEYEIEETFA